MSRRNGPVEKLQPGPESGLRSVVNALQPRIHPRVHVPQLGYSQRFNYAEGRLVTKFSSSGEKGRPRSRPKSMRVSMHAEG